MKSFETPIKSGDELSNEHQILEKATALFNKHYESPIGTTAFGEEAAKRVEAIHEVAKLENTESHEFLYSKIKDLDLRVRRAIV